MKPLPSSRSFCLTAVLSFLLLFSTSCEKKDKGDPVPATEASCLLVKDVKDSHGMHFEYDLAYDAQKRIISSTVTNHDGSKVLSTYHRNSAGKIDKVTYTRGTEVTGHTTLVYDAQGRWVKTIESDNSKMFEVEYDSQNRVAKTTRTMNFGDYTYVNNYSYEYTNGNLTKVTMTQGGLVEITEYEYYLDKLALDDQYDRVIRMLWGDGLPSKNLVKKRTLTRPSRPDQDFSTVIDYTYELNSQGYPSQIRTSVKYTEPEGVRYDGGVAIRSYQCK
ncbi:hypothetical protein DXT99_00105 [Pontibacter diazotrophicus]|uniref:DUF4595 domain-containing protein n=1 Tax=Pontibacter diazotrophicus TaxID=1400979 RepID=A0A3D8LJ26_9BACT|nr:hypothetical protein [Pontibacter diazotrophicus]RDV16962.1 hypothetical protein DXT99_00105 [Pontibacter diazotrophicus]